MKKRKIIAIALTLLMVMGLAAGCAKEAKPTVESLAAAAETKIDEAKSLESKMNMVMDLGMSVEGMSISMKIDGAFDIASMREPMAAHMSGDMNIGLFGFETKSAVESYVVPVDGKYMTYSGSQSEDEEEMTWTCEEVAAEDMDDIKNTDFNIFGYVKENADKFTLKEETEKFHDTDCLVVSGTIPGDYMKEILESTGSTEIFTTEEDAFDMSKMEIDVIAYFNAETKDVVGLDMDCAKGFLKMMEGMEDAEGLTIDEFTIEVLYGGFDTVDKIEVPADVKEKATAGPAEIEDDPFEIEDPYEDTDIINGEYVEDGAPLCTFKLNGEELSLIANVSDFEAAGLKVADDYADIMIGPEDGNVVDMEDENGDWMSLYVCNTSEEEKPISECQVYGITVFAGYLPDYNFEFINGLNLNMSVDEMLAAMGDPTMRMGGQYVASCQWNDKDERYQLSVTLNDEENSISSITIMNSELFY